MNVGVGEWVTVVAREFLGRDYWDGDFEDGIL